MRSLATLGALLALTTMALPAAAEAGPAVEVVRDADRWTVTYTLDADAPAWAFVNSSLIQDSREPWRPQQWRVVTPGVVLERAGDYDILRSAHGGNVPRTITVEMTPRHEQLEADYSTLIFTDGSTALPTGAFEIFAVPSVEEARRLPADLNGQPISIEPTTITWRDTAGPVLFEGARVTEARSEGQQAYVLFGATETREGDRLTTVMDPQLPSWISEAIEDFAPRLMATYVDRLGPGQTDRPTIMAAWAGPTPGRTSMGGSVMPGLIVMNFEGAGALNPVVEIRDIALWFVAHEAAHFWLKEVVRHESGADAWITEGGSDLMAVRASQAIDPTFNARAKLQTEIDDCAALAAQPVETAGSRGEHRAYYACGAVFGLVAEAAQRRANGGDWFDFLRPLIDENRADGVLTRAEWLGHLTEVSGDPGLAAGVEALLTEGSPTAMATIARLFTGAGVAHEVDADGRVLIL